jgi:uncharacterized membrane protein YagU involved in acid resistance
MGQGPGRAGAILYGTLAVGLLDILEAFASWGLRGVSPVRVLQSIAAGLLGRSEAYAGGLASAGLGIVLHFFIAFSVVCVYHLASRKLPVLTRLWLPSGLLYRVLVYFVMNDVVIPLSALERAPRFSLALLLNGVITHALLVGLPSALSAKLSQR